jgi:alpha-glucoside transport system permease protein
MSPLFVALALVFVPLALWGYLALAEAALRVLPRRARRATRAAVWMLPALLGLGTMLVYPLIETLRLSLLDSSGAYVGLGNYLELFGDQAFLIALRNNALWLIFLTGFVTVLGLVVSWLGDKVRYERLLRSIVVLPTAISFVGAGIIWGFVYDYSPPGLPQTGALNAIWTAVAPGADPIAWLTDERTSNAALIFIGIWMATGFATIILTAALKSVPAELLEAARLDGASERHVFFGVVLPHILPSIAVVVTLMMISALKIFDIVYVLTNGNFGTQVLATSMYSELFAARDPHAASAIAVVILLLTVPVLVTNLRVFRHQEESR